MSMFLKKLFKNKKRNTNEITEQTQKIEESNSSKQEQIKGIKIKSIYQYKSALKLGCTHFDFSELDFEFEDIQNVNLENMNFDIDIRKVFVPWNGSALIGNNVITPFFRSYYSVDFLKLNKSRLSGNNITGDLKYFENTKDKEKCYIWYSEETFDEKYKQQHPEFFLSKDAPIELKEKYYNPEIFTEKVKDVPASVKSGTDVYEDAVIIKRQKLTIEEYIKYYEFLKNKYLDNFDINEFDLSKISVIEKYGLEKAKEIFKNIDDLIEEMSKESYSNFALESCNIDNIGERAVKLSISLKYEKE